MSSSSRRFRLLLSVCLLCASSALAGGTEQRLAQFLAGCELLNTAIAVDGARRAAAMRWLIAHTQMTPEKAIRLVRSYHDRPEDWSRVLVLMKEALEESTTDEDNE